jgi:prophage tail gpP-like protein
MVDLLSLPDLQDTETRAVLKVNGQKLNVWKSISVSRSIAQIAGSFSFTTSNRFAGNNEKWNITNGDKCTIEIADQQVITGYIDEIDDGYDLNSHDVTFSGRDKTGDLVDCPYDVFSLNKTEIKSIGSFPSVPPAGEGEFKNQTFLQVITKLANSVNIDVILDPAIALESEFKTIVDSGIETGQMLFEQIAKLCQQFAVLPITTGDGKLLLTRSGLEKAFDVLQSGINIKSNQFIQSDKDRYSVYYVEGPTKNTAFTSSLIAEGKEFDEGVVRTRPFIVLVGEQVINKDICQKRAAWEAQIRAGLSRKISTVVKAWTQTNGKLWPLNGLVSMNDDKIQQNEELLIAGIDLTLDSSGGELTTMSLVHPDTFKLKGGTTIKKTDGLNAFGRPL